MTAFTKAGVPAKVIKEAGLRTIEEIKEEFKNLNLYEMLVENSIENLTSVKPGRAYGYETSPFERR